MIKKLKYFIASSIIATGIGFCTYHLHVKDLSSLLPRENTEHIDAQSNEPDVNKLIERLNVVSKNFDNIENILEELIKDRVTSEQIYKKPNIIVIETSINPYIDPGRVKIYNWKGELIESYMPCSKIYNLNGDVVKSYGRCD